MTGLNINKVEIGGLKYDAWYPSTGYFDPEEKRTKKTPTLQTLELTETTTCIETLYLCRYCFKFTVNRIHMYEHEDLCKFAGANSPGRLLYRDSKYSIRLVDGLDEPMFCSMLCLFSRLFLDSKTIYFNMGDFDFYVLYDRNHTPLGFYSREKNSWDDYNLACILVFPPFQGLGLGKLLIAFSYDRTRREGKVGSPEKPLSTYGHAGYLSYWCQAVAAAVIMDFHDYKEVSLDDISKHTGITPEDVHEALKHMAAIDDEAISKRALQNYVSQKKISLAPIINPDHVVS